MPPTVFHFTDRSHIRISGADRVKFLHNFCTNDINRLEPNQGCEAFVCNAKGRTLGHVTVFAEPEELWLESVPGAASALIAHLDRYIIREDVALHDASVEFSELAFVGPGAVNVLASALKLSEISQGLPQLLQQLSIPGCLSAPWISGAGVGTVRVVDWLNESVYLLFGPRQQMAALHSEALSAGAADGTTARWESLRIDAGFPAYGIDITEENLPQEVARNERCISFTKGCYLGQEPVARLDALGHTNRELRRLSVDSEVPPVPGSAILDAAADDVVGSITSTAHAPDGVGCVALGYLKTRWSAPGSQVRIKSDGSTLSAKVR